MNEKTKALRELAEGFLSRTRMIVERGENVAPVAFFELDGRINILAMPMFSQEDKHTAELLMQEMALENNCSVIFITDMWTMTRSKFSFEELQAMIDFGLGQDVFMSERGEALLITIIGPDVEPCTAEQPYTRQGNKVIWGELRWSTGKSEYIFTHSIGAEGETIH